MNEELTTRKRFKLYIFSVLIAPFGLYWFFKYFRSGVPENKKFAYIVLTITIVTMVVLIATSYSYIQTFDQYTSMYKEQLDMYKDLGY